MKAIVIQAPSGFDIPAGGIVLWYGIASACPPGWEIYTELMGYFPRGGSTYSATPLGAATHSHAYASDAVELKANHTHTVTSGSEGGAGVEDTGYGSDSTASPSHNHSVNGSVDPGGSHRHTIGTTGNASLLPKHKKYYYIRRLA